MRSGHGLPSARSLAAALAIIISALVSTTQHTARACNAYPGPVFERQWDGTQIELAFHGDENFNWYTDAQGFLVVTENVAPTIVPASGENGGSGNSNETYPLLLRKFVYASVGAGGDVVATSFEVCVLCVCERVCCVCVYVCVRVCAVCAPCVCVCARVCIHERERDGGGGGGNTDIPIITVELEV